MGRRYCSVQFAQVWTVTPQITEQVVLKHEFVPVQLITNPLEQRLLTVHEAFQFAPKGASPGEADAKIDARRTSNDGCCLSGGLTLANPEKLRTNSAQNRTTLFMSFPFMSLHLV
jgi:hypothetical protein